MARRRIKTLIKIALPLAVWLGVWQFAAVAVGQDLLLPGPWEVVKRLCALCPTAAFWKSTLTTLGRMLLGGSVGVLAGAAVAVVSAWWEAAKWVLTPMMKIVRATPVASFIILIWLWCKSAWVPVVIAALMSAPVVWSATAQAFDSVDEKLLEMARAYRFSRGKTWRLIYLPWARGAFAAGCKTAMGLAWKAGVAAEVLCRPRWALGTQVYNAKLGMETADLFAWTAVVVCMSFLVEKALWGLWDLWDKRGGGCRNGTA